MNTDQKIIKNKVGLLNLGRHARQCFGGLQSDGLLAR